MAQHYRGRIFRVDCDTYHKSSLQLTSIHHHFFPVLHLYLAAMNSARLTPPPLEFEYDDASCRPFLRAEVSFC